MTQSATFYGIGVGTGDPELLTLKALKYIQKTPVICYLVNQNGDSQARNIAHLAFSNINYVDASQRIKQHTFINILMPMKLNRTQANQAYDQAAIRITHALKSGQDVAFLCEGDPLFFGSFSYLLERLQGQYLCQVIAGISTLHAASAALAMPLARQSDSLVVISGRHSDHKIRQALQQHESVVIMKISRHHQRLIRLLAETNRTQEARYLAYIGREKELIVHNIKQIPEGTEAYFSVLLVTK